MLRYRNVPSIEFTLDNGYMIKADYTYSKPENKYYVSLHIRHEQITLWSLMGKYEAMEFDSNIKTIKSDIADYVTTLVKKKKLDCYMAKYKYEQKCFDKGNEFFEKERLENKR